MSFWSEEKEKQLKHLFFVENKTLSEVAAILGDGCNKNMVAGKLARMRQMKDPILQMRPKTYIQNATRAIHPTNSEYQTESEITHRERMSEARALPPLSPGIRLMDVSFDQCSFAYGDELPYNFCGREKEKGKQYCKPHHDLTHIKTRRKRKSTDDKQF